MRKILLTIIIMIIILNVIGCSAINVKSNKQNTTEQKDTQVSYDNYIIVGKDEKISNSKNDKEKFETVSDSKTSEEDNDILNEIEDAIDKHDNDLNSENKEKIIIGYISPEEDGDIIIESILKTITEYDDVEALIASNPAEYNPNDYSWILHSIDDLLTQNVDVVITHNYDIYENEFIVDFCEQAKVPIITSGTSLEGVPYIGYDHDTVNLLSGHVLAEYAISNWEGKIDLIIVNKFDSIYDNSTYGDTLEKEIAANIPSLDIPDLLIEIDNPDPLSIYEEMYSIITNNPGKKNILVGGFSSMPSLITNYIFLDLGIAENCIIVSKGISHHTIEEIYEAIHSDKINSLKGFIYYPIEEYGEYIVPASIKLAKGEALTENDLLIEPIYIDINNIDDYMQHILLEKNEES